jgi:NADH-quinone oxidoreductase subunit F
MNDGPQKSVPREVDDLVSSIGRRREHVVPILKAIQAKYRYLPQEALRRVCEITEITPSEIEGVATFYPRFRFTPAGRHAIRVCVGTACFVKGAEQIYDAFRQTLEVPEDSDTDGDGLFTVEKVACLGCCMLAPAVQIGDVIYGHLTRQKIPQVLTDFLELKSGESLKTSSTRFGGDREMGEIKMCTCTSCRAAGAQEVFAEFHSKITLDALPVSLKKVGTSDLCVSTE